MGNKFTVIYADSWMAGSHRHTLPKMRRVEQFDGETVADMLNRESLSDCTVLLFYGHSPMQDESQRR